MKNAKERELLNALQVLHTPSICYAGTNCLVEMEFIVGDEDQVMPEEGDVLDTFPPPARGRTRRTSNGLPTPPSSPASKHR